MSQSQASLTSPQDIQLAIPGERDDVLADNADLKTELARVKSEAAAVESQVRVRLEKQFAQHLATAVAAEVEKALQQMQAQNDLDFEHYDYLRQQHGHSSAEVKDLRQRMGAANDLKKKK